MYQLWIIFITVFLAELGDKTQLATVLFAAERGQKPLLVFFNHCSCSSPSPP